MRYIVAVFLICYACAFSAEAAITISEVAWMGDVISANNEWIELYNSGVDVALDGWTLKDGNNFTVALSGTIGSGAYVVLERNRADGSYTATPPFFVYSGALVNGGATLTLTRSDGAVEDQVAGGKDWSNIGGDNVTKETAQYTASGWRTGVATPGNSNITGGTVPGTPSGTTTATTSATKTKSVSSTSGKQAIGRPIETVRLEIPDITLQLVPTFQTTAYVNQMVPFSVTASGIGQTWLNSLRYTWNFGDLTTSTSTAPRHSYRYPGTYVVTVEAEFGRHRQVAYQEITVLPVTISIARGSAGEILIHNNAPYDVDVSGYAIAAKHQQIFPPRSIIGPKGTLTLAPLALGGGYATRVTLHDAARVLVATWPTDSETAAVAQTSFISSRPASGDTLPTLVSEKTDIFTAPVLETVAIPFLPPQAGLSSQDDPEEMPAYVLAAFRSLDVSSTDPALGWPYLVFGAVLLVAIFGTLVTKPKVGSSPRENTNDAELYTGRS